jgi:CubicO group peptidase (beta-lactamase class C family)
MKKRLFNAAGVAGLAGIVWGIIYLNSLLPVITGYSAKYLCSAVFISNRNPQDVENVELNFSFIKYVTNVINYQEKSVTSRFLWGKSKAIFREGFGSTLLREADEGALKAIKFPGSAKAGYNQDTIAWPLGNIIPDSNTGADTIGLNRITARLMAGIKYHGDAFGFMVLHHGIPVAEKYKAGFSAKTRFLSWSMAKSFTNALVGIMVKDGKLNVHQKANITSWENDDRSKITLNDLMQMQSGLLWNEDYGNRSDVTLMLYNTSDYAAFACNKPLETPAGSHWYYSSGSSNIVSDLIRKQFISDDAYYTYPPTRLFNKTGMPHAVFETDPSGTLVGSSYLYATLRDYARFGLLYLQDGVFNGERILPEGWVKYSTTPAAQSHGNYGALFWLNKGKYYPSAPEDMFCCNGHNGQRIFIIPSRNLVVVIVGYSPKKVNEMNFNDLLKDILKTLPG